MMLRQRGRHSVNNIGFEHGPADITYLLTLAYLIVCISFRQRRWGGFGSGQVRLLLHTELDPGGVISVLPPVGLDFRDIRIGLEEIVGGTELLFQGSNRCLCR